jgi:hypothetical protein
MIISDLNPSTGYVQQYKQFTFKYKCETSDPACISKEIYGDTLIMQGRAYHIGGYSGRMYANINIEEMGYNGFCSDSITYYAYSFSSSGNSYRLDKANFNWTYTPENIQNSKIYSTKSTLKVPVPSIGQIDYEINIPNDPGIYSGCPSFRLEGSRKSIAERYTEEIKLETINSNQNLLNSSGVKLTSLPCRDNSNILLKTNQLNSTASYQSNTTLLEPKLYRNNELVSSITPTLTDGKYIWSLGSANEPGSYSVYCRCAQSNSIALVKDANCLTLKPPYLKQNNQDVNQVTGYSNTNVSVKIGCPEGNMVWSSVVPSKDNSSNDAYWLTIGTTYKVGCIKDGCSRIDRDISTKSVNCDASTPTFVYTPLNRYHQG